MDSVYILGSDGELYHHGIKGMRWGLRRFQNRDGSLTTAGRKRYNDELERVKKETSEVKARQRAQKRTIAKAEKVAQAKKELDELKKSGKQLTKETKAAVAGKKVPDAKDSKDKKSEKTKESEKPVETDADKKARLLREPNAKEILENRRLFTDGELNSLKLRMGTERDISSFIPAEVSKGEQFVGKFIKTADTVTKVVDSGSKAWNGIAKISNSLFGTDLPTITEKPRTEAEKIKEKAELLKAKNELAKAQKEDPNRPKTEEEEYAAKTREINAQLARQKALNGLEEQNAIRDKRAREAADAEEAAKQAEKEARQKEKEARQKEKEAKKEARQKEKEARQKEKEAKQLQDELDAYENVKKEYEYSIDPSNPSNYGSRVADPKNGPMSSNYSSKNETSSSVINKIRALTAGGNKSYSDIADDLGVSVSTVQNYAKSINKKSRNTTDDVVYEGVFVDTGRKSSSKSSTKTERSKPVIDAEWWELVNDTPSTSMTTTSRKYSSGRNYVSGYLNAPISGLIPYLRDDD